MYAIGKVYVYRSLSLNMALKLYYDLGSQPSRAVFMFLKLNNIPFDEVFVSIGAGKNLSTFT